MSLKTNEKFNFIDRVKIPGQNWSIGVPEGFVYSTDHNVNAESKSNPSGVYELILMKPDFGEEGDFQYPFNAEISFVTLNYMSPPEIQTLLQSVESHECIVDDENLSITVMPFMSVPGVDSYFVIVSSQMRSRRCQILISDAYRKEEKKELVYQLLKSIEVTSEIDENNYLEKDEEASERNNMLADQEKVLVDNEFYIGVPDGFKASDNANKQFFCVEAGRPYYMVMYKGQRESEVPDIMFQSEECFGIHQIIEHVIFKDCSAPFSEVGGIPNNVIINTKTLSVRYETPIINEECASATFCVIVPGKLYVGFYRANSVENTIEEVETTVKAVLGTISRSDNTQKQEDRDDRFEIKDGVLVKYNGEGTEVTIPDGVKKIGEEAFMYCGSLKSITIPNSVTSIENRAFDSCSSLKSIRIPDSVKTLGNSVFEDCESLAEVTIPSGLTCIPVGTFLNCKSLTDVTLPYGIKNIEMYAFSGCANLKAIRIPDSVTEIHGWAFGGCPDLTIYATSSQAEEYAKWKNIRFDNGDYVIDSITGEPGVKRSTANSRIYIVDEKWSFELPKGLELYTDTDHADVLDRSRTVDYAVKGLEKNGRYFFDFELREVYDDDIVTDYDVLGCRYDKDVQAGVAQQMIVRDSDDFFIDMVFKPVLFSDAMFEVRVRGEGIRPRSFTASLNQNDNELMSIMAKGGEGNSLLKLLVDSIKLIDQKEKTTKKNRSEEITSDPDFIVEKGVLRRYVGNDTDIVIPKGVKKIADSTFSGCKSLKSVVVPEGVKRIGSRCFENCFGLEHVMLPESLEELGDYAFVDCHKLEEVYLSEKLKVIGDSTFSECFALKDVKLPENITKIEQFAFKNCHAFKHMVIPDKVETIGFYAFADCVNMEYLFVPDSVTQFGRTPFTGCKNLVVFTPPGSSAQESAAGSGVSYQNADKGSVTADNSAAKTNESALQRGRNATSSESVGSRYDGYSEYLKEVEKIEKESEERRASKIAEAKAKGKSDADEINMFVTLKNEEKMGHADRSDNKFYKIYKTDFAALKKAEILDLRKKVISRMDDGEYCEMCRDAFMKTPVEDRFDISTKNYFCITDIRDYSQKADEAIDSTKEWYTESELVEARRLMDKELDKLKKQMDDQLMPVEPDWTKWNTAKDYLIVSVRDKDDPEVEILDDCELFQQVRKGWFEDPIVVEVMLASKGLFQFQTTVINTFPMYWGVSYVDIWKAAMKNEIRDRSKNAGSTSGSDYDVEETFKKIKKKYPDAEALKRRKKRKEKEKKEAEAIVYDRLDTLCMFAVADYEKHCGEQFYISALQKNYKDSTKRFQNLKQKQISDWFKEMQNTLSEGGEIVEEYAEGFRNLSLEERFSYITQPVFEHYLNGWAARSEKDLISALDLTGKWYDQCELVYVEKKLHSMLQAFGAEMDAVFVEKDYGYMKDYAGIKDHLCIELNEHNFKTNQFDKIDDGEYWCELGFGSDSSKYFYCTYLEALPWYWGVSKAEVWKKAFENRDVYMPWYSELAKSTDQAKAKSIVAKYVKIAAKENYVPDEPYDRNRVYADIPPYDVVVENVKNEYGQITPENIKEYLDAKDAEAQAEADRKAEYEKKRTEYIKALSIVPSTVLDDLGIEESGVTGSYKPIELSDYDSIIQSVEKLGDFKDAVRIKEKLIEEKQKKIELIKSKAENYEREGTLISVKEAKKLYLQISGLVDVDAAIELCRNKIEELEAEEQRKKEEAEKARNYEEGKEYESKGTIRDLRTAIKKYELAGDHKDAAELIQKCHDRAEELRIKSESEVKELKERLSALKAEHATLGGFFKKKKRIEVEESIRQCEEEIKRAEEPLRQAGIL